MSSNSAMCGPFELVEVIGEGGMGQVWQAVHRGDGTAVAVKVITGEKASEQNYRDGFRREVQAAARLDHPCVVRVLDYGELSEDVARASGGELIAGSPWFAMELGGHDTLADVELPTWQGVREALLGVLDGLAHAHARDLTHRDIKPSNVLLFSDPTQGLSVKLADFGIAHAFDPTEARRSEEISEASAGTPTYMPPEQIRGEWRQFGPWTDLYAFGCMAYELICGRPPFEGTNVVRLALQHVQEPVPPLEPRIDVPSSVQEWIERLLAKRPRRRFQRAADAAWVLLQLDQAQIHQTRVHQTPLDQTQLDQTQLDRTQLDRTQLDQTQLDRTQLDRTQLDRTQLDRTQLDRLPATQLQTLGTTALIHGATVDDIALSDKTGPLIEFDDAAKTPLPPFPPSWRGTAQRPPKRHFTGAGLGLHGLRETALVGREAERDRLWAALGRVRDGSAEAVIVRSEAGLGKSRLAQWLCRRAHEVGSATVVKVRHSPNAGPSSGLSGLIRGFFRCGGLAAKDTFDHIAKVLGEVHSDDDWIEEHAAAATALLHPGQHDGVRTVSLSSPRERHVMIMELIRAVSPGRPVLLWLDDLQWGGDSLGLASYVLEAGSDAVLVIGTVDEMALAERHVESRMLGRLCDAAKTTEIVLAPLDPIAQRNLVRETLALDDDLVDRVARHTGGNPLFGTQLIGYWIARDFVRASEHGFELESLGDHAFPQDAAELWGLKAHHFLDRFGGAGDALRTLQLAAALGRSVDHDEWRTACARAGMSVDATLVDRLIDAGLALRDDHGWSFSHNALREHFERWSRADGVWEKHHECCADMLLEQADDPNARERRRVEHLVEAGRLEQALGPLLKVAEWSFRFASVEQASIYIDRHAQLLDRLGLDERARERLQNDQRRASLLRQHGEADRALELLDHAIEVARQEEYALEYAAALRSRGVALANRDKAAAAEQDYRDALACLASIDEPRELALTQFCYAMLLVHQGESEAPRELLEQAAAGFEEIGDTSLHLASRRSMARTFWYEDERARARQIIAAVIDSAREAGDRHVQAECWHELGEWARHEGRPETLERAREAYQNAEELYRVTDEQIGEFNVRMCQGFLDIAQGEFFRAEAAIRESRRVFVARDQSWLLPQAEFGLACCAAGNGDWQTFERRWSRAKDLVEASGQDDRDVGWAADKIAALCEAAGHHALADQARRVAAEYVNND